jgi:hypothetical protein
MRSYGYKIIGANPLPMSVLPAKSLILSEEKAQARKKILQCLVLVPTGILEPPVCSTVHTTNNGIPNPPHCAEFYQTGEILLRATSPTLREIQVQD